MNIRIKHIFIAIIISTLAGCGGGGGGGGGGGDSEKSAASSSTTNSSSTPEPTSKSVTLSWTAPTTRANGDPLPMSEIAGYEVYYFMDLSDENDDEIVAISDASSTEITIPNLNPGTYFFAIATIDTQNLFSDISDYVETTIE